MLITGVDALLGTDVGIHELSCIQKAVSSLQYVYILFGCPIHASSKLYT